MADRNGTTSPPTPAQELLDLLGPAIGAHGDHDVGDFGMPSRSTTEQMLTPDAVAGDITRFGPLEKVHVFWLAGMSCDGCSVSVTGATLPSVESLMLGAHPGLPRLILHHPVINVESGPGYMRAHEMALAGELDAPYVVVLEGSIADETISHRQGGYWSAQGEEPWGPDGQLRSVSTTEWVARLAPGAAAAVAIGTCATWGGVPAAEGNPTGAMSLMDFLGKDYVSVLGVPVVNIPGCAPVGDNFTETVAALLYFLQGFGPLPEFDELGRPAWLFGETVHRRCVRGAYYEEGVFADEFGDPECLVEVGCWGPVVNCNITSRGAIKGIGGCMNAGGACIGCTMPGFPDKFTPFYKRPPGSLASSTVSRMVGSVIRPLRKFSNNNLNREVRWDKQSASPSGWAREVPEPSPLADVGHKFYDALRRSTDTGRRRGGIPNPYDVTISKPDVGLDENERRARIEKLVAANGHIKDLNMDPVTRVAGALAVHVTADLAEGRYLDSHAQATLFRGYEVILMGRDPRDAIFVSSRACGVCGGVHAHAAAYAIEAAMGLRVPPLGTVIRNMQEAAEMGYDNPLHLYLLAGPDYSESVVRAANPELWPKAESWPCPNADIHGFKTMAELMTALNPLTGLLYREGLEFTRLSREMFAALAGKFPHPQTVVPGGVSTTLTMQSLNEYHSRLGKLFDYAQKMLAVWDDIPAFFYEADERYMMVGARKANQIDPGYWDDPYAYDSTYENCNSWGEKRWSTPGVVIDGKLVTTRLTDINIGWEEFVEHSYYEESRTSRYETDPLGNPISPYHPWNKRTLPKPGARDWKDKYTWACAPRWDRQVVEAGAYSRMLMTAMAQKLPSNDFIFATGHSMRMLVPKGERGEREVEWHVPEQWNAFERNRGRAYHYLFSQLVGLNNLLEAYSLFKQGERQVAAVDPAEMEKAIPQDERRSVGWWGAGRGWLTHHLVMDKGKITNYQICTPSTINASPRDPWGQPGPYEEAVMNTPIIEDVSDPSRFTSIDMLRAIRSFDPCMPCTTHAHTGDGDVVREVNTCSCGAD